MESERAGPQASRWVRAARLAWAAPCSLVGLVFAGVALLAGGRVVVARGTLEVTLRESEASWPALTRVLPFRAIALGHVVIAIGRAELNGLRRHEQVHVRQYERWGIAFFPAYAASSLWQLLHGRSAYWDNRFEVEARRLSGEETTHEDRSPHP
jgi:hypothetical protein